MKKGNYDDSVLRAAEKLTSIPTHASSLETLKQAYPAAVEQHLDNIKFAQNSGELFHFETELKEYEGLNRLYAALKDCSACLKATQPKSYESQENEARSQAARVRFEEGEKLMAFGDRKNARVAFEHFERVENIAPNFSDINKKLDQAYFMASFKVVVEQVLVTSKLYKLSNEYFQNQIDQFLHSNNGLNKFVKFYTPDEAVRVGLIPDHVITLQFDDFVVGQVLIEKNTETLTSKDSVKISEKVVDKVKIPQYGKVTAKFTHITKSIHSTGLLDMQIKDYDKKKIVTQEKFSGEHNWRCEWAQYVGDERALTPSQLKMTRSQELFPPDHQQLFIEFSKPIYDRLTNRLRNFYAKY